MKIEQKRPDQPPFVPVTITLESREEAGILAALIGPTSSRGRVLTYQQKAVTDPDQFPPMVEGALFAASKGFSALYARLNAALNNK